MKKFVVERENENCIGLDDCTNRSLDPTQEYQVHDNKSKLEKKLVICRKSSQVFNLVNDEWMDM